LDAVADLTVLSRAGRSRSLATRSATIRRLGADGAVLLPPSFSSALSVLLSGTPHRVGFAHDGRSLLLNAALPSRNLRDEHLSQNYLRLGREVLSRMGIDPPLSTRPVAIEVFDHERKSVASMLEARGVPPGYAVVLPGAIYGSTKHWPADRYRRFARQISGDVPVVLAGGSGEADLCDAIAADLPGVFNLAGDTSLGELFALLEGSRVVVANDSGAPHAAASLGVPVVVIFGSTSPVWTRPIGERVRVVREPVHCSPCFLAKCPTQLECYQGIEPDRVAAEVRDAMSGGMVEGTGSGRTDVPMAESSLGERRRYDG
jgi:heptosyltransferase-2